MLRNRKSDMQRKPSATNGRYPVVQRIAGQESFANLA